MNKYIQLWTGRFQDKRSRLCLMLLAALAAMVTAAICLKVRNIYAPFPLLRNQILIAVIIVAVGLAFLLSVKLDFRQFKVGRAILLTLLILVFIQALSANFLVKINTNVMLGSMAKATWNGHRIAWLLFLIMAIYLVVICVFGRDKKFTAERFFLVSVIPLSVAYLILMLPGSVPDTKIHFLASYRLSNMFLGEEPWVGRIEDINFYDEIANCENPDMRDITAVLSNLHLKAENTELASWPEPMEHMEFYSVFCYLPQVLGMTLGRLLGLGSVPMIYLGRLFMLLSYILACFHAIKRTPVGKFLFAAIPLLPMSLMLSSAISYDPLVLVSTLNFLACSLWLCQEPDSRTALAECMAWAFLVGAVKGGGYLILLPVVLMFWNGNKRRSVINIGAVVGSSLVSVILFDVILPAGSRLFQFGGETDKLSASFAFKEPLHYVSMLVETYIRQLDGLMINMGGTHLALLEVTVPCVIIVGLMLIMGIYSIYEKDNMQLRNRDKQIFSLIVFLELFLTPVMLLSWTTVGSEVIDGLQGRYYLPVLPLIVMVFAKFRLHAAAAGATEEQNLEIRESCYKVYALLSCVSVYYMMRLYLTR